MKYPFQPELLDALPEDLAELFRELELVLLDEICSRLKVAAELNEVTVQDIKALRAHGIDLKKIKKAIQKATGISEQKLNKLLDDVVERNQLLFVCRQCSCSAFIVIIPDVRMHSLELLMAMQKIDCFYTLSICTVIADCIDFALIVYRCVNAPFGHSFQWVFCVQCRILLYKLYVPSF
jgi:DNA-binding Xre family transcriptional regulator